VLVTHKLAGEKYAIQAADPGEYRQLIDIVPSTEEQRLLLGTSSTKPVQPQAAFVR
jgi:hypothetical protein